MKLHPISISALHYVEAGQFIQRLFNDTAALSLDLGKDPNIKGYMDSLRPAFDAFNLALQQIAGQKETKEIFELDIVRDHCIISIRRQIAVFEYDTEMDISDAYRNAMRLMKNYNSVENLNYEAETLSVQNLLAEWGKPENVNYKTALNLNERLKKLEIAEENFDKKFGERSVNITLKEVYDAKALLNTMLESYRLLAEYTLVMAKQKNADPMYGALLDSINNIRKYFADIIARRKGEKGGEGTEGNKEK